MSGLILEIAIEQYAALLLKFILEDIIYIFLLFEVMKMQCHRNTSMKIYIYIGINMS